MCKLLMPIALIIFVKKKIILIAILHIILKKNNFYVLLGKYPKKQGPLKAKSFMRST